MKVSIIIPVYNCQRYVADAIRSCLNQTYKSFEVIVVDDASTDDTVQIIHQQFKNHLASGKIRFYQHDTNRHTGVALNTGIKMMKGQWFKEMQADDLLLPNALSDMLKVAIKHPKKEDTIFYANVYRINEKGETFFRFPETSFNYMTTLEFNLLLLQHNIGNGISVLIHKSAFEKHGLFDETTKHEDYEMRLRWCLVDNCRMYHIDSFVGKYRHHPDQYTMKRRYEDILAEDTRIKKEVIAKVQDDMQKKHYQALVQSN